MTVTRAPVGSNVRRLRTRAGLSVVELARRAGVGRATLTQLEAGGGNPTLETLYALANELGVALADLLAEADLDPGPRVVRRAEGPSTGGAAVEAHLLCRSRTPALSVEIYALTLISDHPRPSAPHPPGTREHLHLHSGHAVVGPVDDPVELEAGDYADYPADVAHQYRRGDDHDAQATLTILTPQTPVG